MRERWIETVLGKLVSIRSGVSPTGAGLAESGKFPFVKVDDLNISKKYQNAAREFTENEKLCVPPGSVLFAKRGAAIMVNKVRVAARLLALDTNMMALTPDQRKVDGEFLYYFIQKEELSKIADISSIPQINNKHILPYPITLPPLMEQRKIATILRIWDEALDKLTALRVTKAKGLEGLTQRLLGRGGVFPGKWPVKPLSAIASRVRRQNGGGNHPVMTISAKSGFLMQSDKFARDMAGTSVDRYTLLHEGEFAYNKGNSLAALYGCIYRLDRPTALVPFVYFCFALKPGHDHGFYEHLFAAGALNHQLSRLINSGVRNDGLLNLNVEDFFGCKVPVPPLDEQRRIALALSAAKQELALLDEEIKALTRQKRGLMQKLLTGEWPVQIEKDI